MTRDPTVEHVLSAIADRDAVDWEHTFSKSGDEPTRRTLEALRVIARMQQLPDPGGVSDPGGTSDAAGDVPTHWGTLEILERIGAGSFGTVYRARDPALDLEVALKVLHAASEASNVAILEEGRWLAKLRHPNVVRVYGVDERDGRIGLRMELIRGRSLDRIVREEGPIGPYEVTRIGMDLCHALSVVHGAGLVHGDLKAQNVMRDDDGRIVLMDFGAGSRVGDEDASTPTLRGTPIYLAPEVIAGGARTTASDIYALGTTLYFLVSGRFPIEASTLAEVDAAHAEARVTSLAAVSPDLPDAFVAVVAHATDPSPDARQASAAELARALARVLVVPSEGARGDSATPTNLPPSMTRFIGRRRALEELSALASEHRLVTLTGPGGSGKTRLAVELGASLLDAFADGVWMVPLAPVRDAAGVISAIERVLGVPEQSGEASVDAIAKSIDAIARHLDGRHMLLLLDNCERVAGVLADHVTRLLSRGTSARILATSREPIGIPGEWIYGVSPLDVPASIEAGRSVTGDAAAVDPDELVRTESIQLFVDRARAAAGRFELTDANRDAVANICRRLDGLPLALELAAAQVRSLPVDELARRLETRLDVLRDRGAPEPAHHETLGTSISWSLDRLTPRDREALVVLSTFVGGWSLEAAETVLPEACGMPESEVIDVLSSVTSKSLVHLTDSGGAGVRYEMLETVREYTQSRPGSDATRDAARPAFVSYYLALATSSNQALMSAGDVEALARLESERHNLLAAVRASVETDDLETAMLIAGALGRYWMVSARTREGLSLCRELLAHPASSRRSPARATVASWCAVFVKNADGTASRRYWEEALSIRRDAGDQRGIASVLNGLAVLEYDAGNTARARDLYDESLALRRELDEERGIAQSLTNLALCSVAEGRLDDAAAEFEEALAIHRRRENVWGVAHVTGQLGFVRARAGALDEGRRLLEEAIAIHEDLGPEVALSVRLGFVYLWSALFEAARERFRMAVRVNEATGDDMPPSEALRGLALVALHHGEHEQAARLLGASARNRFVSLDAFQRAETEKAERALREALGDAIYERAWTEGADDPDPAV